MPIGPNVALAISQVGGERIAGALGRLVNFAGSVASNASVCADKQADCDRVLDSGHGRSGDHLANSRAL